MMTVADLIELLRTMPPEALVRARWEDSCLGQDHGPVFAVEQLNVHGFPHVFLEALASCLDDDE